MVPAAALAAPQHGDPLVQGLGRESLHVEILSSPPNETGSEISCVPLSLTRGKAPSMRRSMPKQAHCAFLEIKGDGASCGEKRDRGAGLP